MTRLTKYTIHLISGLLLALLTAGCVADRNVSDCVAEGDEVDIEFALKVPALETSLRQLSDEQESQVNSVKVLVFNTQDASGQTLAEEDETFAYVAKMTTTNFIPDRDGVTHVVCKLTASDQPMRIVCIANYDVPESILTVGTAKKTILEDAQMTRNFTEKWPTSGDKYHIPMWGESDAQPVNKGTRFNSCAKLAYGNAGQNRNNEGVIHLVRALARVDVGVNFEADPSSQTAAGSETFKIKSVRVYRYATSMYVAGTQATAFNFDGKRRNALPHTPEGVQAAKDAKPLEFTAQTVEDEKGYVRNIYIPEIENKTKTKDQRICLVVGGFYKGASKETYYRVDFIKRETKSPNDIITKQLDILRNYRYRFNITDVKGPGTDTPEEALTTEPVNINWDVLVWDEGEIDEIMYDGQYYLIVSKDKFHFGKDATSESYTIRTNWEGGYQIVDANGKEWPKAATDLEGTDKWAYFTATGSQKEIDKDMTSTVNVLENGTDKVRSIPGLDQMNNKEEQQLFVKAGRIWWPLQITQSNKIELDIKIYEQDKTTGKLSAEPISFLELKEGADNAKLVAVRYTPGANLERQPLTTPEKYTWTRLDNGKEPGKALYRVEMMSGTTTSEDLNIIESSRFRITKSGAEAYADLAVSYMNYNAIPYRDKSFTVNMLNSTENYVLINVPAQFFIKANAPYKLTIESIEPDENSAMTDKTKVVHDWVPEMTLRESGGMITGEKIPFQPFDWIHGETYKGKSTTTGGLSAAVVTFTIAPTDPEKHFKPKTFKINLTAGIVQPEANCYIMKADQQVPILIPLSRINTAAEWYKQYEEECNEIAESRIGLTGTMTISKADYEAYAQDGYAALPRLEDGDHNVEAAVIWSTIGATNSVNPTYKTGISVLKTVVVGGKNYLLVALDAKNKGDEGNAVVGVRRPNTPNEFLWSWHIWVVTEYPWEQLSSYSRGIFMNRNLGALYAGHGLFPGETNLNYVGLFYQFGRKDPFYMDDISGNDITSKIPKERIYLGSQTFKSGIMKGQKPRVYGNAVADYNKLYTMKQLIRYPYKIAGHDRNEEYILETAGPNKGRKVGTLLWQGEAIYTRHDRLSRDQIALRTKKTPFDPSPYGWKVPSVGMLEMGRFSELNSMYFINNGFFKATGLSAEYVNNGLVHLHTATTDIGSQGNDAVFNNGAFLMKYVNNRWEQEFNTSAFYPNAPASALPVRPVQNERETDYKKYTVEGFYRSAR